MVLGGRLVVERGLLRSPVAGLAAQDPDGQARDPENGDEEGEAHPRPGGHPFTGQKNHGPNYHGARTMSQGVTN